MKTLILVIYTVWSFNALEIGTEETLLVEDPQDAMVYVYESVSKRDPLDMSRYDYKLYELDPETKEMKEIPFPGAQIEALVKEEQTKSRARVTRLCIFCKDQEGLLCDICGEIGRHKAHCPRYYKNL